MKEKEVQVIAVIIILVGGFIFSGYFSEEEIYELGVLPSENIGRGVSRIANQCIPQTCLDLNTKCGQVNDGCGQIIDCGTCPSGKVCWGGACLDPGLCGNNLDCGLNEPAGDVFCQGNTIYQDVRIYECSQQATFSTAWIPGAVCTNHTERIKLHQCPDGSTCQAGLCYKQCSQDTDCPYVEVEKNIYQNLPCVNNLCPESVARQNTDYAYCRDSDGTLDYYDVNDPSFQIPGYIFRLQPKPTGATYIFDNCELLSPTVMSNNMAERKCDRNLGYELPCSSIVPDYVCRMYRSSALNQYVPFPINVGVCS